MGLRFRRTLKIAPGLRLNFNKNSVGLSIGPRGAKYTINSSGRRTASVGIPGSGLYYTESQGGGKRKPAPDDSVGYNNRGEEIHLDEPGLFAGRAETIFYEFANQYLTNANNKTFEEIKAAAEAIKSETPDVAPFIDYAMIAMTAGHKAEEALAICERLYAVPDLLDNKIAKKYFDQFRVTIPIARGITYPTITTTTICLIHIPKSCRRSVTPKKRSK